MIGGATVGDVVTSVGDPVLRVAYEADLSAQATDVVILDRTDEGPIAPGAVILGVGVEAGRGDALGLIDRAGRSRAGAVVLRAEELPRRLVDLAASEKVTVLCVPAEMPWGQLYSLLRTALSGVGATREGAAGVPVGDLFALADAVAVAVGAPVTVEDPQWRVLAYSNLGQPLDEPRRQTILGRTPPPEWQERLEAAGIMRALRTGDVVRFEHEGISPRAAAPVRAGRELLGSIWAAGDLTDAAREELVQAARLAAVHMMAHRASEDVERRSRGAAVREALEGRSTPGRLGGFSATTAWSVIAFEPADADGWEGDPDRVLSILALFAENVHRDARSAQVDERLWALIPTPAREPQERLEELATRVVKRAEDVLGERLRAGIGCSVERLPEIPRSRQAAEQALAVLARRGGESRVAHFDDVRPHALLMELLDLASTHDGILEGPLVDLAADQLQTLRTWLDCHGDVAAAAARLGIHPNTLRYRLKRIAEVTGLDLADPDQRLLAEVQLRVLALAH